MSTGETKLSPVALNCPDRKPALTYRNMIVYNYGVKWQVGRHVTGL